MPDKVALMLLTYSPGLEHPRSLYAQRTLRSALDRLRYSGPLSVHIADDGSGPGHVDLLREIAGGYASVQGVTSTSADRRGYGASYNEGTRVIHDYASYVLPLEDDWELREDLDLDPLIAALSTDVLGCVRLGYLGHTQRLDGSVLALAGQNYLALDPASPEPHVWAGHPRLEARAWQRLVGPWPTGLNPGETEFSVAHRPAARVGVGWPLDTCVRFLHIGSVSFRETL